MDYLALGCARAEGGVASRGGGQATTRGKHAAHILTQAA